MFAKFIHNARAFLVTPIGLVTATLVLGLLWVFWPTLVMMMRRWTTEAEYSHGYLVPVFAIFLLWWRRQYLDFPWPQPSWWGLGLIALGLVLRAAGTLTYIDWLGGAALLPCLAGLFVLVGGWRALRWSWPAIAFLLFMVPLPYRVESALAGPLQRVAATASTLTLQTLGFPSYGEGNIIRVGAVRLGVEEACSGLSMLVIFFALATAVIILVKRPLLDKAFILLSAVPIALIANVTRIVVTGALHVLVGSWLANLVFHDVAGWLMMVLALGLLWVEFQLISWVLIPDTTAEPMRPDMQASVTAMPAKLPGKPAPQKPLNIIKPTALSPTKPKAK